MHLQIHTYYTPINTHILVTLKVSTGQCVKENSKCSSDVIWHFIQNIKCPKQLWEEQTKELENKLISQNFNKVKTLIKKNN